MKSRVIIAVVLLLALLSASAGCARSGKGLVDIMKKVPVDSTSFNYWAVERFDDEELWDIYEKFRESLEAIQLKDIGVVLSSVKHAAKASGFDGSLTVLSGDFAIENIEKGLEDKGYQKTTHQETGIWTPQDEQGYKSVALQKGTILIGDMENLKICIDTMVKEEEYSLYEDPDIKLVTDKLVTGKLLEGIVVNINKADSEEKYADLIAYGKSYEKEDESRLKLTAIYMFQDGYAAGQAQDGIKGYLGTKELAEIKVEREGNFIRATGLIYITDFVEALAF